MFPAEVEQGDALPSGFSPCPDIKHPFHGPFSAMCFAFLCCYGPDQENTCVRQPSLNYELYRAVCHSMLMNQQYVVN